MSGKIEDSLVFVVLNHVLNSADSDQLVLLADQSPHYLSCSICSIGKNVII